uniref:Uncharacterized protein n=1 Tax=Amphimedon queenslandica TaxID=400682 RepID=A0A1X7UT62_AMPQE
ILLNSFIQGSNGLILYLSLQDKLSKCEHMWLFLNIILVFLLSFI